MTTDIADAPIPGVSTYGAHARAGIPMKLCLPSWAAAHELRRALGNLSLALGELQQRKHKMRDDAIAFARKHAIDVARDGLATALSMSEATVRAAKDLRAGLSSKVADYRASLSPFELKRAELSAERLATATAAERAEALQHARDKQDRTAAMALALSAKSDADSYETLAKIVDPALLDKTIIVEAQSAMLLSAARSAWTGWQELSAQDAPEAVDFAGVAGEAGLVRYRSDEGELRKARVQWRGHDKDPLALPPQPAPVAEPMVAP